MKKVFAVAVMMLVSMTTFAQNQVGQITVMPKAGLNIADMQKADDSDVRIGAVAGAEFEYGLTDMIGLSAGAIYSAQGTKYKSNGNTLTYKADYINVPLLANVYVLPGFAVKAGVQFGFNINDETSLDGNGTTITRGSDAKTIDFSIPVGVSYQYQNLVFDCRYNYGLTKVWEDTDYKNSVFQFTVGYKFAL